MGSSHQNVLISPLLLVLWLQNVTTDHEKSWPANVLPAKNFGHILKNKMAAIANYFKIIKMLYNFQLGSSALRKRCMARKVSLIVIWSSFENKMAVISHVKCDK